MVPQNECSNQCSIPEGDEGKKPAPTGGEKARQTKNPRLLKAGGGFEQSLGPFKMVPFQGGEDQGISVIRPHLLPTSLASCQGSRPCSRRRKRRVPLGRNRHRSNRRNTHHPRRYRHSVERPIVSVSALLRLVDWLRRFRATTQGGQPCERTTNERPPFTKPANSSDSPLGSTPRSDAETNAAHAQSNRRQATRGTSRSKGGVS